LFDTNGDGTISSAEIGEVLKRTTGKKPSQAEIRRLTKNVDQDHNNKIDFNEFVGLLENNNKERHAELKKVFDQFDTNKNGFISKEELVTAFSKSGEKVSDTEITEMLARVDTDKDGRVNFVEFCKMMNA